MLENQAILMLEDGSIYKGVNKGFKGTKTGELCFNTGMTGYQEVFTDPSYFGQIIVMTSNHIGNYGVIAEENECDRPTISGLICKEFSEKTSRNRADDTLGNFFNQNNVVAIEGVDTRELVRAIRTKGAMKAVISSTVSDLNELKSILDQSPNMDGLELASEVSTNEMYDFGNVNHPIKIAAYDFGIKKSILKCFDAVGCHVRVFPAKTPFEIIKDWNPNGLFLSNGPGDPKVMDYAILNTKKALDENMPIFGICLGHQILALASGAETFKMHHGHRGLNHPVKNIKLNICEITSQNHGFEVDRASLKGLNNVIITHENLNDHTIEGIERLDKKAFSVQYHPESSPGPHDSRYLFEYFKELIFS
jgi:carbamoyl-phosphate synthase small subunit